MKKVLVFHRVIAPYRIDFFNELNKLFELRLCMFWRNLKDQRFEYKKIENQLNFDIIYNVKEEFGVCRWIQNIWSLLSEEDYEIVYVSEYGLITLITILHKIFTKSSYKIVSMVDDSYSMISQDKYFSTRHKYAMKLLIPFIDEVQVVEPLVCEWYNKHYGKGIYFPIICDENKAIERQIRVLPISKFYVEKYHLANKKVILFVGRLVRIKNVQFAIDAFLKANVPDSVFVVVGSGEEENNLQERYKGCENVKIVGRFEGDELYAWYNVASVFTLPSIQEAFGAVTNEALVAGCKVLISKDAGSNCLVKEGENGYVIDPYDEREYVVKLKSLFQDATPLNNVNVRDNMMKISFKECFDNIANRLGE